MSNKDDLPMTPEFIALCESGAIIRRATTEPLRFTVANPDRVETPADVEVLAEAFYLVVMQAAADQWADWQHADQAVRAGYYDHAYEVAERVRGAIAPRIENLCVVGSDDPLAVGAECARLVREVGP